MQNVITDKTVQLNYDLKTFFIEDNSLMPTLEVGTQHRTDIDL